METKKETTEIKIEDACRSKSPMTKAQARLVLERVNPFNNVTYNFDGIIHAGQAFCHELFIICPIIFPDIEINYIHANKTIENMINYVFDLNNDDE